MNIFSRFFKETGKGILIVTFISSLISGFIFNYFHFDDRNIFQLTTIIGLPIILSVLIYIMYTRRNTKNYNN